MSNRLLIFLSLLGICSSNYGEEPNLIENIASVMLNQKSYENVIIFSDNEMLFYRLDATDDKHKIDQVIAFIDNLMQENNYAQIYTIDQDEVSTIIQITDLANDIDIQNYETSLNEEIQPKDLLDSDTAQLLNYDYQLLTFGPGGILEYSGIESENVYKKYKYDYNVMEDGVLEMIPRNHSGVHNDKNRNYFININGPDGISETVEHQQSSSYESTELNTGTGPDGILEIYTYKE